MKPRTAAKISAELLDISKRLNAALWVVKRNCEEEEFKRCRRAIGTAMGTIYVDILRPLYEEHPTLMPPELRDAGSGKKRVKVLRKREKG